LAGPQYLPGQQAGLVEPPLLHGEVAADVEAKKDVALEKITRGFAHELLLNHARRVGDVHLEDVAARFNIHAQRQRVAVVAGGVFGEQVSACSELNELLERHAELVEASLPHTKAIV